MEGIQTQTNSLSITRAPQAEKKRLKPIGETSMGVTAKK